MPTVAELDALPGDILYSWVCNDLHFKSVGATLFLVGYLEVVVDQDPDRVRLLVNKLRHRLFVLE
jgi:hypothetical protein